MFRLKRLGDLVWALYEIELRKQGFIHQSYLETAASFGAGVPDLENAARKALGDAMFAKLPWDIFSSARYGRLVWESNLKMSLAPERVYLETRGWLQLAADVQKNLGEIAKIKELTTFEDRGGWKVWSSEQGFIALRDQVRLVGAECTRLPESTEFDGAVATLEGGKQ